MDQWQIMQNIVAKSAPTKLLVSRYSFQQLCLKRWFTANLISGVLQYLGLMLATLLLPPSLLWFSAGVAVGLVFLRGYKILPGIFLGSFAAYLWAGSTIYFALLAAILFTLQPLMVVWLSHKMQCYSLVFYQRKIFIKFLGISAVVTALISGILAYSYVQTRGLQLWPLWQYWWLADLSGLLIFGIALVTWDAYIPELKTFKSKANIQVLIDFLGFSLASLVLVLTRSWMMVGITALVIIAIFAVRIRPNYHWPGVVLACFLLGLLLSLGSLLNAPLFNHVLNAGKVLQWGVLIFTITAIIYCFCTYRNRTLKHRL